MSVADTLTGARSSLVFLYAYQNAVARDIGRKYALALSSKMAPALGTAQGKLLRERIDIKDVPPVLAASLAGAFLAQTLGIRSLVTEGRVQKAVIKVGRCPFYEAAQALGIESAAIEALCRAGAIQYVDALIKQFNPDLDYDLNQFRPSAEAPCIVTIVADSQ